MTQIRLEAVKASAGSGKTYRLTTRYLSSFSGGAEAESVLATTFTRKAAGEILGRVLKRLALASESDKAASVLGDDIGRPLTRDDCRKLLMRLCASLHRVSVLTLDSLFSRLLQAFRFEVDAPSDTSPLESKSPEAQQMRLDAIEALLGGGDRDELVLLLDAIEHGAAPVSVTGAIDTMADSVYEVYRASTKEAWFQILPRQPLADSDLRAAYAAAVAHFDGMPKDAIRTGFETSLKNISDGQWASVLTKGLGPGIVGGGLIYNRKQIADDVVRILNPLIEHAKAVLLERVRRQTEATYSIMQRYDEQYTAIRRKRRAMLFSDVPLALANCDAVHDCDALAYRLDGAIDHLLLDEFQDTSPNQWSILQPLAQRIVSATGDPSLFCVGDLKQAIYGWRGASQEIFGRLDSDLAGLTWVDSNTSYRSSPVVLGVVDRVFGSIPGNGALAAEPDVAAAWHGQYMAHEAYHGTLPGYVELLSSPAADTTPVTDSDDDAPLPLGHIDFVAKRIAEIARDCPASSIGVLMRANKDIPRIILALDKLGVRASAEGGSTCADDPGVGLIVSALTLADHPGDTAAAWHVAGSPLAAVIGLAGSDPASAAVASLAIRHALSTEGYGRVIGQWATSLAALSHARGAQRLAQLIDLADAYDRRPGIRPGAFVKVVLETPVEDPSPARVRLLSIHKSKGLEFDIVVLPELGGKLFGRSPTLLVDRESPIDPIRGVFRYASEAVQQIDERIMRANARRKREELRDSLCLLYVAMTRARYALHMIVPAVKPKPAKGGDGPVKVTTQLSLGNIVAAALAGEPVELAGGGSRLFAHGDASWYASLSAERKQSEAELVTEAPVARLRVKSTGDDPRTIRRVAPSSAERDGIVDASRLLALADTDEQQRGSALHALLATVAWTGDDLLGDDELAAAMRFDAAGRDAVWRGERLAEFKGMVGTAALAAVLGKPPKPDGAVELWRERRFAVVSKGRMIHGSFDRVVIERDVDTIAGVTLIDFKTDNVPLGGVNARVLDYRPQLALYREALAAMLQVDDSLVTALLVFSGPGVVVGV